MRVLYLHWLLLLYSLFAFANMYCAVMKLKKKLKLIRSHLGFTQDQMADALGLTAESRRARVSEWEIGRGEPRRDILIIYSELAKMDIKKLIDDKEVIDIYL